MATSVFDRTIQATGRIAAQRVQETRDGYEVSLRTAGTIEADRSNIYKLRIVQQRDTQGLEPMLIKAWLPDIFNLDITSDYDTPFAQLLTDGKFQLMKNLIRAQWGASLVTQDMTVQVWSGSAPWDFSLPFVFMAENSAETDVVDVIQNLMTLITPDQADSGFLVAPGPTIDVTETLKQFTLLGVDALRSFGEAIGEKGPLGGVLQGAINVTASGADHVIEFAAGVGRKLIDGISSTGQKQTTQSALPQNNVNRDQRGKEGVEPGRITQTSSKIRNRISLHVGNYLYFPAVMVTSVGQTYNTVFDQTGKPVRATVNVNFRTMVTPVKQDLDTIFLRG